MKSNTYQYIFNPLSNRWVHLNGKTGINVMNLYLNQFGGAGLTEKSNKTETDTKTGTKTKKSVTTTKKAKSMAAEQPDEVPLPPQTTHMSESTLLIVITDVGEEVDDEATLSYLKQVSHKQNFHVNVLFVGGGMSCQERKERAIKICGPATFTPPSDGQAEQVQPREQGTIWYGNMDTKNDVDYSTKDSEQYDNRIILQIGPVSNPISDIHGLHTNLVNSGGYDYIILGDIGETTNAKNASIQPAKILASHAEDCYTVRTKHEGKTVIPPFTGTVASWTGFSEDLKNEILFLGFKNTLGRAPPLPFTVHLVGKGGSNYETVNSMTLTKYKYDLATLFDNFKEDRTIPLAKATAKEYFDNAKSHPGWNTFGKGFREKNLTIFKTTHQQQEEDLAKMLFALHKLYGLKADDLQLSEEITLDNVGKGKHLHQAYLKHLKLIEIYPDMPLTPAFDLVAGIAAVSLSSKNLSHHFNTIETKQDKYEELDEEGNVLNSKDFTNNILVFKYMGAESLEVFLNTAIQLDDEKPSDKK